MTERACETCGFIAHSVTEEIAHMESEHPEIIDQRLREAGVMAEDYRNGPDLPSIMTLAEFRLLATMVEQYASPFPDDEIEIAILVRDRGRSGSKLIHAPWIEFSAGKRQFAIWRHNGDVYEVGPDGTVSDEPLHRND